VARLVVVVVVVVLVVERHAPLTHGTAACAVAAGSRQGAAGQREGEEAARGRTP
jgi:hypothetical protein